MTKALVAAVAVVLAVISVAASAQQENATKCPRGRYCPPPPRSLLLRSPLLAITSSSRFYSNPLQVVAPVCVVSAEDELGGFLPRWRTCPVSALANPGSYCTCSDVFSPDFSYPRWFWRTIAGDPSGLRRF